MSRLRVGVVGVGHLGRHHARILAGLPEVELVGVADARPDQARAIAAPLGTKAFDDFHDLLGQVDAVSIAVPTSLHLQVASVFLTAGVPALVEKPLAATIAEAERLVELAEAAGVPLAVGHVERFNPAFEAWMRLGWPARYVAAERLGTFTFRSADIGVVHDLMIHDLDLLLASVQAPVRSVAAVGVSLFGPREDVANARIEFANGCIANLTASRASFQAVRKMRFWSASGYATLDFGTRQATLVRPSERLRQGDLALEGVDLTQPAAIREHVFGTILEAQELPAPAGGPDQLTSELADFVHSVRSGVSPRVPGTDALAALRVADQVVASLNAHQWDGRAEGPFGPRLQAAAPNSGHRTPPAPKAWSNTSRSRPLLDSADDDSLPPTRR